MAECRTVYGYVNGDPTFSADEFVYKARKRGAIEDDDELLAFAKEASHDWYDAGWCRSFTEFFLSDYALDEPRKSLTNKEFARLKELQRIAREKAKAADDAREWKLVGTYGYADNSVEELWQDKDGVKKVVMTVWPHGDVC